MFSLEYVLSTFTMAVLEAQLRPEATHSRENNSRENNSREDTFYAKHILYMAAHLEHGGILVLALLGRQLVMPL